MQKIRVGLLHEIPVGAVRKAPADPPVAVFHTEFGFFAVDDTCTHGQASLAEGYVEGAEVECPLHMARFCLRTGKALCAPATSHLARHEVRVEDGVVFVEVRR